jgi:hypothetical protein
MIQLIALDLELRYFALHFLRTRAQLRIRLPQGVEAPAQNNEQDAPDERGNGCSHQERTVADQRLRC